MLMIDHEKKKCRKYRLNSPFEIGKQAETAIIEKQTSVVYILN